MDIDQLRELCLSLKGVTEDIKWGHDLCFSIGGKMFCVASLDPPFNCSFKVKDEEFEELSRKEGFIPAPYMARAKWVKVTQPSKLNKKEWNHYIRQSYELKKDSLTKKMKKEIGLE